MSIRIDPFLSYINEYNCSFVRILTLNYLQARATISSTGIRKDSGNSVDNLSAVM